MTRHSRPANLSLNIPPSSPTSNLDLNDLNIYSGWGSYLRLFMYGMIPFLAPAVMEFMRRKTNEEKEELEKQHYIHLQDIAETHKRELKNLRDELEKKNEPESHKKMVEQLDVIEREEEKTAGKQREVLEACRHAVKVILDYRCSTLNPGKSREDRVELQHKLIKTSFNSPLDTMNMYDGLVDIFDHDHKHCGFGFHNNGRLYRVYMQLWRKEIQVLKYKRVLERLRCSDL